MIEVCPNLGQNNSSEREIDVFYHTKQHQVLLSTYVYKMSVTHSARLTAVK